MKAERCIYCANDDKPLPYPYKLVFSLNTVIDNDGIFILYSGKVKSRTKWPSMSAGIGPLAKISAQRRFERYSLSRNSRTGVSHF